MFIGKKKIFKIGRIKPYKIVTTILAITSVTQLEKDTVGRSQAKRNKVKAVRTIGRSMVAV
jgi:hypothetical protein